jgi:hypothetical protein
LILRAYLFLGPIEALACMFGFFWVLHSGGWTPGTMLPPNDMLYLQATTACLTAIIIAQTGNVFACRSSRESIFRIGFFSNRLIFVGIAAEVLLGKQGLRNRTLTPRDMAGPDTLQHRIAGSRRSEEGLCEEKSTCFIVNACHSAYA